MVRREAFSRAGGFNKVYGKGYFEDVDLCFTIKSLGYKIFIDTDAGAVHGTGQTFKNEKNPPPLQQNQMIFNSRWANSLSWTEYEFW